MLLPPLTDLWWVWPCLPFQIQQDLRMRFYYLTTDWCQDLLCLLSRRIQSEISKKSHSSLLNLSFSAKYHACKFWMRLGWYLLPTLLCSRFKSYPWLDLLEVLIFWVSYPDWPIDHEASLNIALPYNTRM